MSSALKLLCVFALGIGMALSGCGGGGSTPVTPPGPPAFTTTSLPAAVEGTAYNQSIQATGVAPLSFSVSTGTLPAGLSLNGSTGAITGTPTGPTGASPFTIEVTEASTPAQSASEALSITVNPAATLTITNTSPLTNGNINAPYSATLLSTGGVAPITWSVTGGAFPTGVSLNGSTGAISGTPTESGIFSVTFQAADSGSPQQLATKALGLTIDGGTLLITTTRLLNPMAGENYNQTIKFTGGTLPVTWSVTAGALPTGLSLDTSTGAITGNPPLSAVGTSGFTVQLQDSSAPLPQTATQPLNLTVTTATACGSGSESLLTGQYAIQLKGFDASGPAGMLASFTADGAGNITAGVEDINSSGLSGVQTNVPVTTADSSYTIGSDHRGCLTLVAAGVTRVFRFAVELINAGVAGGARIIEFDTTGTNTSGTVRIQDPSDFSNAAVSGNYAFRAISPLTSAAGGGYFAALGVLNLAGTTVTGSGDININGIVDSGDVGYPATPITFTAGTYNIGANGRGTMSFTPPGSPTIHAIVYVLFTNQLFLMSSDAQSATNTVFSGDAQLQTLGSYTNSSLSTASLLFANGQTATGAGGTSRVEAGVFTPDGIGSFTLSGDQNSGGTISGVTAAGTYSVASNGRVQVTNTGGTTPTLLVYMVSPSMSYVMSTDTHVMAGDVESQSGGPFANASLSGTYSVGTINPFDAANVLTAGVATYDGAGNVTGTFDINESGFLSLGNAITGTYAASANGRVVTPASGTTQRLIDLVFSGKAVTFGYTSEETNPTLVVIEQ
jgi:hypothetical protein